MKLGVANSRMKDFYDLYVLARSREFHDELLANAVRRTFARRKTAVPPDPFALSPDFYRDPHKQAQWRAFLGKSPIDAPADFSEVGDTAGRSALVALNGRNQWSGG